MSKWKKTQRIKFQFSFRCKVSRSIVTICSAESEENAMVVYHIQVKNWMMNERKKERKKENDEEKNWQNEATANENIKRNAKCIMKQKPVSSQHDMAYILNLGCWDDIIYCRKPCSRFHIWTNQINVISQCWYQWIIIEKCHQKCTINVQICRSQSENANKLINLMWISFVGMPFRWESAMWYVPSSSSWALFIFSIYQETVPRALEHIFFVCVMKPNGNNIDLSLSLYIFQLQNCVSMAPRRSKL